MDDRRFDALTRSLATEISRRKIVKRMLGLGGVALAGSQLQAEAARRPNPTPKPLSCPGRQVLTHGQCVCPDGTTNCGPDCCPSDAECCDNACCFGTCYAEERCCPTNDRAGGLSPTNRVCDTNDGPECCLASDVCCLVDGCCATVCTGGVSEADSCCATADFCPGSSGSTDLCCAGNTTCCNGGASSNACVDLSQANACCHDSECDSPPAGSTHCAIGHCVAHVCQYTDCNASTEVCCPNTQGVSACRVGDECCLTNYDCEDTCEACANFVCVDDPNTFPCGPENDPEKFCCPETNYDTCCGRTQYECCGYDRATGVTRQCNSDGHCCDAGELACNDQCCPNADTCCDGECCAGSCLRGVASGEFCCPSNGNFVCNTNECCTGDQNCCAVDGCCATVCTGGASQADSCCAEEDYCPGATPSADLCCAGNTTCCNGGTSSNACVDLSAQDACCRDTDCDTPPSGSTLLCPVGSCVTQVCVYTECNGSTEICCPDNDGFLACRVGDECCVSNSGCTGDCEACLDFVCVDTSNIHCGSCGVVCDVNLCQACQGGACIDLCLLAQAQDPVKCNGAGECVSCKGDGESCTDHDDCCGGLTCNGSICQGFDGGPPPAEVDCSVDGDCNAALCQECQNGICTDICPAQDHRICDGAGTCVVACLGVGESCPDGVGCCPGLTCNDSICKVHEGGPLPCIFVCDSDLCQACQESGICIDICPAQGFFKCDGAGTCVPCLGVGASCSDGGGCCSGLTCDELVCQEGDTSPPPPPPDTSFAPGAPGVL